MRYLFHLGHPAHFHLFRNTIQSLREEGHEVEIAIKTKDVLERLLQDRGWTYRNILQRRRGDGTIRTAWSVIVRDGALFRIARSFRPDVMIGTSVEITHVGRLLRIPSIVVNEDDHDVVPLFALLAYPLATCILAPHSCRMGRWRDKTVFYEGYHELAYLHPNHFTPDSGVLRELSPDGRPYFLLRLAQLTAHHDTGRSGIHARLLENLLELLRPHGHVYITAERALESQFEPFRIQLDPLRMHDALAFADLYVGDSQTMAAEAAVLGTPSVRFNDFVGEIGYLNELEQRYGLTIGIRTTEPERLLQTVRAFVSEPTARDELKRRREQMLAERIDVAAFLHAFLVEFPRTSTNLRV